MSFLITHIDVHESLDEDIQFKIDNALGIWTVSYTHLTLPTIRSV